MTNCRVLGITAAFMRAVRGANVVVIGNDIPEDAKLVGVSTRDSEVIEITWEHESFAGKEHLWLHGPTFSVEAPKAAAEQEGGA